MPLAPNGFPRSLRLTKAEDFKLVFAKAAKSSDVFLCVLARANGLDMPRLGLAIAKRNVRKAADRNRIKRISRESFRLNQHQLAGLDFVVMARAPAIQADHEKLFRSLQRHWDSLVTQCKASWSASSSSTAT